MVPPHWADEPPDEKEHDRLEVTGTALKEPDCEHDWCRLKGSIKWSGPGERGYWIDPNQQKHPFHPQEVTADEDPVEEEL